MVNKHFAPYTHGKITKQDAALMLQGAVDKYLPDWNQGIFLVRESSKANAFVLNVLNGSKVHNYLFTNATGGGFDLMGTHFDMPTMDHLVAHFMAKKQDGMSTKLYYYVVNKDSTSFHRTHSSPHTDREGGAKEREREQERERAREREREKERESARARERERERERERVCVCVCELN